LVEKGVVGMEQFRAYFDCLFFILGGWKKVTCIERTEVFSSTLMVVADDLIAGRR
jgi:hypothetical protein